ncbi:MAG: hypothetical protein AAF490_00655 [Chloroflexota bacterium]
MRQMLKNKPWVSTLLILIFITANSLSAQQTQLFNDEPTPTPVPTDGGSSDKPAFDGGSPVESTLITPSSVDTSIYPQAIDAAPVVVVWYEDELVFGENGNPQNWVNILGNVSGAAPNRIELEYKLNGSGGFKDLSIGGDKRRLGAVGDFNIELDIDDLIDGDNTIQIRATNTEPNPDQTANYNYSFTYSAGNSASMNYTIDWSTVDNIHDVAQVVDGQWTINNDGTLSPNNVSTGDPELYYDRTVAFGDMSWTDYEVTVPLTIHGVDPAGWNNPSNGPGVGLIFRWNGHYQEDDEQPRTGWHEVGGLGWFRWAGTSTNPEAGLQLIGWSRDDPGDNNDNYPGGGNVIASNDDIVPVEDQEYIMKMNVATTSAGDVYRMRVWKSNLPEPSEWHMEGLVDDPDAFDSGSVILVSHHVDVSFGDVTVEPLTDIRQTITFAPSANGGFVTNPNTPDFAFGSEVQVTAVPEPGYEFVSWGGDLSGTENPATLEMSEDYTVSAIFQTADPPLSDDFNACVINNLWTEVNPASDPAVSFDTNGTQLELFVPSGSSHDLFPTNNSNEDAIRVMQDATDEDFVIEVKFDSVLNASRDTVMQGVLIEEDADNYIRFDFQSDGSNIIIYHVVVANGNALNGNRQSSEVLSGNMPYMQIRRVGNSWDQFYSEDGSNWVEHDNGFTQSMTVNKAGVFAGNAGNNPSHTVLVDYFYNTASRGAGDILSVDIQTSASPVAGGTVNVLTNNYGCGDSVQVQAVPAEGFSFVGWEGDLSGTTNPATVTADVNTAVVAKFEANEPPPPTDEDHFIYLPVVIR